MHFDSNELITLLLVSLFLWGVTIWFCMENVLSQSIVCNGIIREIWASFIKFGISSLWCCVTVWWARDRAGGIIIVRFRFWLLVRLVSQSQSYFQFLFSRNRHDRNCYFNLDLQTKTKTSGQVKQADAAFSYEAFFYKIQLNTGKQ